MIGKPQHAGLTLGSMLFGSPPKKYVMERAQALEILKGAVDDYYKEWAPSAADLDFMNLAEKISDRTQNIHQIHKKFNGREAQREFDVDMDDDDGEEQDFGNGIGSISDEEFVEPEETADSAGIDVKETMSNLRREFMKFIQDFRMDREQAVSEIARLTAEVDALRDRLAEAGSSVPDIDAMLADDSRMDPSSMRKSGLAVVPAKPTTRLERLQERAHESGDESDDEPPSIGSSITPVMSPRPAITDFAGSEHIGVQGRGTAMPRARAPEPLSLPSNFLGNSERSGERSTYVTVMQSHQLLPSNFRPPSELSHNSPEWPDEISMPGSKDSRTPPGSNQGDRDRPGGLRHRPPSSAGSLDRDDIINLYDLDLDDDSFDDFSANEDRSVSDGEMGDGPVGIAPGSVLPKVHATRVADGVGFGTTATPQQGQAPHDFTSQQDFEFTSFRDAQSQLRHMLSKHKPATRFRSEHPGTDEI
mmetsp:Transcript_96656/g.151089  ORF Transcript_96656/g.151089 Transcript_96656/m.151089 type:complete len:475 (+) Transcript_96656:3-1427(+)